MKKEEREAKLRSRLAEMSAYENELRSKGYMYIAGIDEVGRGPLAGPVVAAAVILPVDFDVIGIDDSKKVSKKKRIELNEIIRERAVAFGIGWANNVEIDEINILEATKLAMKRAIAEVNKKLTGDEKKGIDYLLIDAVALDGLSINQESVIKGDAAHLSIAAASIVAKVERDMYMEQMDKLYPGYGFESNKGYGTKAHYDGIRQLGPSQIHRMLFLKNFDEKHR